MTGYNAKVLAAPMPDRIKKLPISPQGYPVPWFVPWIGDDGKQSETGIGTPDFRMMDSDKFKQALKHNRCWICGELMGVFKAFTIGPMCSINKVIGEPPQHRECAIYSATVCPFLSKPKMKRNTISPMPDGIVPGAPAGFHLARNPGACCVWVTKSFRAFRPQVGGDGILFSLGNPVEVQWFCEGRKATRAEVMASIESGYPQLLHLARQDGSEAIAALERQKRIAIETVVPA